MKRIINHKRDFSYARRLGLVDDVAADTNDKRVSFYNRHQSHMTGEIYLSEIDQVFGQEFGLLPKEPKILRFATQAVQTILERWFICRTNRPNEQDTTVEQSIPGCIAAQGPGGCIHLFRPPAGGHHH